MNGTGVGYARGSADEQDVIIQAGQLLVLGVPEDRVYVDRGFSAPLAVTASAWIGRWQRCGTGRCSRSPSFGRFARDVAVAGQVLTGLSGRGVLFGLGGSVYGGNDPFGWLFLQTLARVAELEAGIGHQRTREGMVLAKKNGKFKGKQPEPPGPGRRSIRRRYVTGGVSLADLATEYGVGCSTVHRIVHRPAEGKS